MIKAIATPPTNKTAPHNKRVVTATPALDTAKGKNFAAVVQVRDVRPSAPAPQAAIVPRARAVLPSREIFLRARSNSGFWLGTTKSATEVASAGAAGSATLAGTY